MRLCGLKFYGIHGAGICRRPAEHEGFHADSFYPEDEEQERGNVPGPEVPGGD